MTQIGNTYGAGLYSLAKEENLCQLLLQQMQVLQEAFEKIEAAADLNAYEFIGNIEGGDILSGKLDVVVCDGFSGNVIIKGFESVGLMAAKFAEDEEKTESDNYHRQIDDPYNMENASGTAQIRRYFDYNSQAGAIFVGTKKLIIKAHGAANEDTICSCILQAINLDKGRN